MFSSLCDEYEAAATYTMLLLTQFLRSIKWQCLVSLYHQASLSNLYLYGTFSRFYECFNDKTHYIVTSHIFLVNKVTHLVKHGFSEDPFPMSWTGFWTFLLVDSSIWVGRAVPNNIGIQSSLYKVNNIWRWYRKIKKNKLFFTATLVAFIE